MSVDSPGTRQSIARGIVGAATLCALLLIAEPAASADAFGSETNLPIPRFVSLRSAEVNMRTGPGTTYPIEWVYVRRGLPVEVLAEFDVWRKIRDWQGTVGWVHQSMLDGGRTVVVVGSNRKMRSEPSQTSAPVARLAAGVIGGLLECTGTWCRVEAAGYRGWLPRNEFWGVGPDETIE